MKLALAGLVLGLAGSLALTRVLSSLLFGVSARDPLTIVVAAALLAASPSSPAMSPRAGPRSWIRWPPSAASEIA